MGISLCWVQQENSFFVHLGSVTSTKKRKKTIFLCCELRLINLRKHVAETQDSEKYNSMSVGKVVLTSRGTNSLNVSLLKFST